MVYLINVFDPVIDLLMILLVLILLLLDGLLLDILTSDFMIVLIDQPKSQPRHVLYYEFSGQMFREQIGWVVRAVDLMDFRRTVFEYLLYVHVMDFQMTHAFAVALTTAMANGRRRI